MQTRTIFKFLTALILFTILTGTAGYSATSVFNLSDNKFDTHKTNDPELNIFSPDCTPPDITAVITDVSCKGGTDGAIDITVSGGTPPYTFTWTDGTGSGSVSGQEDQTGLTAGSYLLTVTDNLSCSRDTSFTISEPATSITITGESSVDATCNGTTTGSITVTASGGTGALVYTLNPGGISNGSGLFSNLAANTYTVSVTDANNCGPVVSNSLTVGEPPAITISSEAKTDITCNGNNNGTITVVASGGTGQLTYTLNPGGITNTIGFFNGLAGGAYTVQVSDANSCGPVASNAILIVDPAPISITSETFTNITCSGANDGTITITATGGTNPLKFTLNPGSITNGTGVFTNLSANTYTVTVSDINGCVPALSSNLNITEPIPISITSEKTTDITCNGVANGEITVQAIGGTGILTYTLNPGGISNTTGTFQNLTAATYTVSITDGNSCGPVISNSLVIDEPPAIIINSTSVTDASCYGAGNGSIVVSASGGTGSVLIYTLSPGAITNGTGIFSGLIAGNYSVSVTDINFCGPTVSGNLIVGEPTAITITSETSTNISCHAANDGTVTVTASGGTGTLNYTLNPGGITNTSGVFTALSPNSYTVSVSDANSCGPVTSGNLFVTEPATIIITSEKYTDISCNGAGDGTVTVTAIGGSGNLIYTLNPGGVSNTSGIFTNLIANTYTVSITDDQSCGPVISSNFNITEPPPILINSESVTDVSCNGGSNGSVSVSASGGTGVLVYTLNPGGSVNGTGLFSGLSAGTYSVSVTDLSGCGPMISNNLIVGQPAPIIISGESSTDISCNGANDGTITIVASGGTGTLTYTLNPGGISNTSGVFTGLSSNNYTVNVTDLNSCGPVVSSNLAIKEPPLLVINSQSSTNISCNGANDGTITVTASGGTPPYMYSVDGGSSYFPNGGNFTGLTPGNYDILIRDANACITAGSTLILTEPAALSVTGLVSNVSCNGGNDGAINITVSGGTLPYSFSWSNGSTAEDLSGLTAGTFTVSVTDANGCSENAVYNVVEPTAISISGSVNHVSCNGASDGSIDLTVSGGTQPYSFAWSNGSTSEDISGLSAGLYTVTVTDANSCTANASFTLTEPSVLVVTGIVSDVSCNGGANGAIDLTTSGGTTPYSFAWSHGPTSEDVTGLTAGNYSVTVTDANNCVTSTSFNITEPLELTVSSTSTNISCNGLANGSITISASQGTPPYEYSIDGGVTYLDNGGNFTGLSAGNFDIAVRDAASCVKFGATITITEPVALDISSIITDVSCNGGNDGAVSVTVSGGIPPYTYSWSNGSTTKDISNLSAGNYTLTVVDANGCPSSPTFIVSEPQAINISVTSTHISCNGLTDGAINIIASLGTAPYEYSIDGGITYLANGGNFPGLSQGNYDIAVRDASGCIQFGSIVTLTEPLEITLSADITDVNLPGGSDGIINLSVSGGTSPYTYVWSNGATTEDISGLTAGEYFVTVTDANGCTANDSYRINEPEVNITITEVITNVSCNGANDGSIKITIEGGIEPYTVSWSTSDGSGLIPGNEDQSGLSGGTYDVLVTDNAGDTANGSYLVTEPTAIGYTEIITDVACFGETNGSIEISGTNGNPPYEYSLNGGTYQSSGSFTGLAAGDYVITLRDNSGCAADANLAVSQPASALTGNIISQSDVSCGSSADGSVTVEGSGGISPYEYNLNGGSYQSSGLFENLSAGNYTVTVRDANTCTFDISVTINTGSSDLDISITDQNNVLCYDDASGSVSVAGTGGVSPYEYSIDGGNFQASGIFNGLTAKLYTLTVRDANQCTSSIDVTLTEPSPIVTNPKVTHASCPGTNDGSIELNMEGGTTPYSFRWSNSETSEDLKNISSGTYSVEITDGNSCIYNTTVEIQAIGDNCLEIPNAFIPNGDGYNDTWKIRNIDYYPNATVEIFTRWGQLVYSSKDGYNNPWDGRFKGKDMPMDAYYYVIDLKNGKKPLTGTVTIMR